MAGKPVIVINTYKTASALLGTLNLSKIVPKADKEAPMQKVAQTSTVIAHEQ